ncbi:transmembrane protein with metallophosphoesterase domain-like [Stylophora pistillata]|uniref:Transmembrane protein with metallophosphoesterase domain n=1 Tax=Stylophora pistillata TaxID=50429 RepID=A0A2B4SAE1_STYPI|nr:transmembrane protein with metallophosphoesterase domain-like [Stylophora pistillata]PFX26003.1 Transmembrane protein with metallophosphoesterase domain [Stylophora pistillata]
MASGKSSKFDKVLVVVGAVVSINVVSIIGTYFLDIKEKTKYKLILIQSLLATQSLLFFTSRYLWLRLCSPLFNSPSVQNRIIFLLLIVVLILAQGSIMLGTIFSGVEPHWISLLSYICLGLFVLLTTATFLSDFVTWLFGAVNTRSGSLTTKSRYARFHVIGIIIISCVLAMVALHNGLKEPLVKNIKLPVKNLPPELNGFTIVHLPDLHVGPTVGKAMLEKTVRAANQLNPDVIALTGDLVDSTVYQIRQAVKPLLKLKARYGVYFVTGNHEYYTGDVDGWLKELEYLGVTPLHNSHVMLTHPDKPHAKIFLAGVDDVEGGFLRSGDHGSDLTKALKGVDKNIPTILLAHRPKVAKLALDDYSVDVVLAGHTHGGQLFPIHLWHLVREPYFAGLYQHKSGSYVYVSSGVHFWGMPMRLWSEAEITHVTLTTTS